MRTDIQMSGFTMLKARSRRRVNSVSETFYLIANYSFPVSQQPVPFIQSSLRRYYFYFKECFRDKHINIPGRKFKEHSISDANVSMALGDNNALSISIQSFTEKQKILKVLKDRAFNILGGSTLFKKRPLSFYQAI